MGDTGGKKPREGYVCRACGGTEHYLEDCLVAKQGQTDRPRRDPAKEIARTCPLSATVWTLTHLNVSRRMLVLSIEPRNRVSLLVRAGYRRG